MQFLKNHYEKVILSIVLLGLAVAAAALPLQVSRVRNFIDETVRGVVRTTPKAFEPISLTTNKAVLDRLESPPEIKLAGNHNLFNPVLWKKRPDGSVVKIAEGDEIGPAALKVTALYPLELRVSYTSVSGLPDNPRYQISILRQTDANPRPTSRTTPVGTKNDLFTLLRAEGPVEAPIDLVLLLKDENEPISIGRDRPYVRVIGHAADLAYPPEKQVFQKKRVKDTLRLEKYPDVYTILAINPEEVVVSANSTQKKTTIKVNATP